MNERIRFNTQRRALVSCWKINKKGFSLVLLEKKPEMIWVLIESFPDHKLCPLSAKFKCSCLKNVHVMMFNHCNMGVNMITLHSEWGDPSIKLRFKVQL